MRFKIFISLFLLTNMTGCQTIERYIISPTTESKDKSLASLKQSLSNCRTEVGCTANHYNIAIYYLTLSPSNSKTLRQANSHLQQANKYSPENFHIKNLLISTNGWLKAENVNYKLKEKIADLKKTIEKAKAIDLEMANQL